VQLLVVLVDSCYLRCHAYINVTSAACFELIWSSPGRNLYVVASLYWFLHHCSKRSGWVLFEVYILYAVVWCGFHGWWVITDVKLCWILLIQLKIISSNSELRACFWWCQTYFTFRSWRRKRYVPPKRPAVSELHCDTSQKTVLFIVAVMRTSNPTNLDGILPAIVLRYWVNTLTFCEDAKWQVWN
jgi:hypothetical protein